MSEFVTVDGRVYQARRKAGKQYHLRLTVGRNWKTGKQLQHDYTGATAEEVQRMVDDSRCLSDEQMGLVQDDKLLVEVFREYQRYRTLQISKAMRYEDEGYFRNRVAPYFSDRAIRGRI